MKKRITLQDKNTGNKYYLFNIDQSHRDGSIYLRSPEFTDYKFNSIQLNDLGINILRKLNVSSHAHVSFHATGQTHLRLSFQHKSSVNKGNTLVNLNQKIVSLRHLFTLIPQKPNQINSSMDKRLQNDGDFVTTDFTPFGVIALAIPKGIVGCEFNFSTSIDDFVVPGFTGFVITELDYHNILFITYKSQFMADWQNGSSLYYSDGYSIPVIVKQTDTEFSIIISNPTYKIENNILNMTLNLTKSSDEVN